MVVCLAIWATHQPAHSPWPWLISDTCAMPLLRDEGVVIRTHKLGEADRIVTLLCRDRGKVRAVAKGVRRTSSSFGARLEPLGHVDVQFFTGKGNLETITQVESLDSYGSALAGDYGRWTAGQAMVEAAEKLTPEEGSPALQQYLLLVGGLRALVADDHHHGLVLDAFLLRSLSVAGWAPSFDECARCGEPGPHRSFHLGAGGVLCADCRLPGSARPTAEALALMSALLVGEWAAADATDIRVRREATGLTSAYVQWHLEHRLRSLPLVDRA
jgi:DNA repair protein RecO (recombination protein O)